MNNLIYPKDGLESCVKQFKCLIIGEITKK